MALTPEQKALNKAAQRERDQKYRARRKEYDTAKEERIAQFHASTDFKSAMDKAMKASDEGLLARDAAEAEICREIEALQAKLKAVREEHSAKLDVLNAERRRTNRAYFEAKQAVENEVDAQFNDIAGIYSAAAWANGVKG